MQVGYRTHLYSVVDLGNLSNNDGDAYENVTQKRILAASVFIGYIPSPSIRQMVAIFLELNSKRLYQSSGIEKERRCPVFTSSTKREIRHFHVSCSRAPTAMKCTKKRVARAKLLFCQSKPIAFLPISLPSPPLLLKLPSD